MMKDVEILEGDEVVFEVLVIVKLLFEVKWYLRKMLLKNEGKYIIDEDFER